MDEHTLKVLSFDSVVREVADNCLSEQGRRLLSKCVLETEPGNVKTAVDSTSAYKEMLIGISEFPQLEFPDIEPILKPLSKMGAVLEPVEIARIGIFISSSSALKKYLLKNCSNNVIVSFAQKIPDLISLSNEIFSIIDRDGEVRDEKIPELKELKKKIRDLGNRVEHIVGEYTSNPNLKGYLQSDLPTVKDGRTVLPVKSSFRSKIKGIVHEISSTGATVFLEPFEAVELNNEIVKQESLYRQKLLKILRDLTAKMAVYGADIDVMSVSVASLDSIYAKARYAIRHRCFPARYNKEELVLKNGRHPLIDENKVVPLSLSMGEDVRILVITGPNTGGKTVSLKTLGLLMVMNQFGLEIPSDEGTILPVIDNIFADIGDEQSIEQSLSTFSSHMVNISRITAASTSRSLVLLDELGAGTDPEEGVAIAMALLDHFIEKGCIVLSTTHHGILKNYGYTRKYVENASMEFDTTTLTPQYRLVMGIPGASYAITVAEKNGIPKDIVTNARSYLEDERTDISELIKKVSEKHRELLVAERMQQEQQSALTELKRKTDLKELKLRQKEYELRSFHLKEIKDFLWESRQKLESLVRELREGEVTKEKLTTIKGFIGTISERVQKEEETVRNQFEELVSSSDVEFKQGSDVKVKGSGKRGRIIRKGKGESWIVETETLKVSLFPNEMDLIHESPKEDKISYTSVNGPEGAPVYQLDVRGLRLDEAIKQVEKQIDNAILRGLHEFSIVHGMGDGILKRGIHEYLKTLKYVRDFFFSMPEQGGFGRTIVILKAD